MTNITITVVVPDNTPVNDSVSLLNDIVFLDGRETAMTKVGTNTWQATMNVPRDSILRYYYSRGGDWDKKDAYVYRNGQEFAYRELVAQQGLAVTESIAKWEDLPLLNSVTGTLEGVVTSTDTGQPVMGLRVSAGQYHTITRWDGSYRIFGVPAGPCAVTLRADNGEYQAYVVQVNVPADGTFTQNFLVAPATMAQVTFNVTVPADTPAGAVPRIYGDTYRAGFFSVAGGTAIYPSRIIDMTSLGNGVWTYTVTLGQGTCLRYLYTLGDFRINHEKNSQTGQGVVRAVQIAGNTTLNDTVSTWKSSNQIALDLDVQTPTTDTVYVTTDGWGGWEPLRMWSLGGGRWKYTLFVDPNQKIQYRYVRTGDSSIGMEKLNPDANNVFRTITLTADSVTQVDKITAWRHQVHEILPSLVNLNNDVAITTPRVSSTSFFTGIELIDYWRVDWKSLVESTVQRLADNNCRWTQIASVWDIRNVDPPIAEPGGNSFTTEELVEHIRAVHNHGMKLALRSFPYPRSTADEIGFNRSNTNEWYDGFFAEIKACAMYHAKIAQQEGVEMLILANFNWADNSNAPKVAYINSKWKTLIADVRKIYSGKLSIDYYVDRNEYDWYGDLDYLGDKWWVNIANPATNTDTSFADMKAKALQELQNVYLPRYTRFNKPFVFTELAYYSADSSATQQYAVTAPQISDFDPEDPTVPSDWTEQARAYEAVLWAFAETNWVQGAFPFGYAYHDFDSKGFSIRAKTAEKVVQQMYQKFNAAP